MTAFQRNTLSKLAVVLFCLLQFGDQKAFAQAPPVAAFTASATTGCAPLTVHFTDQSTGNPFSWNWDFGNGQLSTARNPSVNFSQPGIYTVRLIVKNANGLDEEIKTNYISVAPSPTAAFQANMTTACVPATIQFTDNSTIPAGAGTIASWLWDFGDGNTSTQQNPSHTYNAVGFYTVSLLITSTTGCQNFTSIGRYIRLLDGIDVDFTFTEPGRCQAPFLVNFQNQAVGPGTLSYSWNFGNGGPGSTQPNPTASYPAAGTYPVTLNVQSNLGCSGSLTKNIVISGKTTDFTFPSSICIGQTVTFQNNSVPPPQSSYWDFGDGTNSSQTNPSKFFLTTGMFPVKLINDYGNCMDSITKNVTVISQPPVNFTLNDSASCKVPFTVQFTDQSPGAATWLWDFGDGGTSNLQNPSHTYNAGGYYSVTLTITLPGGCSNSITKSQFIRISPAALFVTNAPSGGCAPYTFSPIPLVQSVDNVVSYSWDMGETGGAYNTQFPTHTYNNPGNYTIKLTVTTQNGCTEVLTLPDAVKVGTKPNANFSFTPNNVCASTPVQFTDLSTGTTPGGDIRYRWMFGDGLNSTQQNPLHIYKDTGNLQVRFIVINNGCPDTATQSIFVLPPVAKFGYTTNCNNRLQVTFVDTSLADPVFGPVTYEWRMGDPANTVFYGPTPPTFTYPTYGTYTATLKVTNGPCSYTTTKDVVITNETAGFSVSKNPVCKGEPFILTATGSNAVNIKDYTWTIGGTTIADTTRTLDYRLFTYGTYDVTLIVEDINGCLSSVTIPNYITVNGPRANFSPNTPGGCVNSTIGFTDQSTILGSPIAQWTWSYGDGSQQVYNASPFTHQYTSTGSYNVTLAIKDNFNCADTITINNIVLITQPDAAFKADTIYCPQANLQFTDTSSGSGLTYNWDFGDGGVSTLQNPVHAYPAGNNVYTVKLKIRDVVGCEDSITKVNYIDIRKANASFDYIDSAGICIPLRTSFSFTGSDYKTFLWDFGDNTTSTTLNPAHFYNSYGSYTTKLYVYGPGGCVDSAERVINLYDPILYSRITANPDTACNSATVTFNLVAPPGFKFKFNYGDGSLDSSNQFTISHFYASPGMYFPTLIIIDPYGCEAHVPGPQVSIYGAIPLFGKDKKEFCDNGEVFFVNYTLNNDPIISSVWDFGDGNTSTATDPSHIYNTPGTYIVSLTVVTQNQCLSRTTDTVRVYKTPELNIIGRDTICVNIAEIYRGQLTQADSTIKWKWDFGNGSQSQTLSPSITYNTPGDYTITLIAANKLGCADTSDFDINVVPLPTAAPVVNPLTIISGGSAPLAMNYTGSVRNYLWSPNQNLDCNNCPAPVANPQFSTKYKVMVQDRYGCRNTGEITVQVICTGQNFFVPNTFSPNGDGSNDVFYLRGTGLFRIRTFRIFDRWGEVVFENREFPVNSPAHGWNGSYKGKKAKADVYVYQLEIVCSNGEIIKYSGNIALIL